MYMATIHVLLKLKLMFVKLIISSSSRLMSIWLSTQMKSEMSSTLHLMSCGPCLLSQVGSTLPTSVACIEILMDFVDIPMTPWFKLICNTFLFKWWDNIDDIEKEKDVDTIHKLGF